VAPVNAAAPTMRDLERSVRVLLVLDDRALANTIDLTLRHGGYIRRSEETVGAARVAIAEWKPHLLLLDIDLDAGAAIQLIDDARAGGPMGIIALTRRSDLRGKLDAFERGADDYIGVPFVPDDLVARARAVLRRTHGRVGELVPRLRIGDLEIDVLNRKVLALWGTDFVIESNVVDRHVRALRAKLQNDWHRPRYIETVPGSGYRFVPGDGTKANGPV